MQVSTTVRSPMAIGVGLFFFCVTGYVILEDYFRYGNAFSTRHLMAAAVLVGTIFFGHKFYAEYKEGRYLPALGCALLTILGLSFEVLSSAGRSGEVISNRVLTASAANAPREIALRDVSETKDRYDAALAVETKSCAALVGIWVKKVRSFEQVYDESPSCKASRINTIVRRTQYDEAKLAVAKLPPAQVANGDIAAAADLLSRIPFIGGDQKSLEATLTLLLPFVLSVFCGISTIVSFAIGLGHVEKPAVVDGGKLLPAPAPVSGLLSTDKWSLSVNARKVKLSDSQMVLKALHLAGRPLSNAELADALEITEGESTKRRQACEVLGLVCVEKNGKAMAIRPSDHVQFDADGNPINV